MQPVIPPIPEDTSRRAKSVFGAGNFYIQVGDHLDGLLAGVFGLENPSLTGQSQLPRAFLPLITIFQHAEMLTDSQAAEAIRMRLDWKYALHLPHTALKTQEAQLCRYRQQALREPCLQAEIQLIVQRLDDLGVWKDCLFGHPSVPDLIAGVCALSRAERITQALSQTIEALTAARPEWMRSVILPHWYTAYRQLLPSMSVMGNHRSTTHKIQSAGEDAFYLIKSCREMGDPELANLPEVKLLEYLMQEQYGGNIDWNSALYGPEQWTPKCSFCH